ncbi:MAG: hypothetical protein HYV35_11230 [Lentisphaerae bacterium]|nr:hypothetical protein [Lentisphaerota bacterium]
MKHDLAVLIVFGIGLSRCAVSGEAAAPAAAQAAKLTPVVVRASRVGETPPVRELTIRPTPRRSVGGVRVVPIGRLPQREPPEGFRALAPDPVVQRHHPYLQMPSALMTFEGIGNLDGVLPPDNNGDVGPNHYVEMVNFHFCVYDKTTGTNLITPTLMSALYYAAGFTGGITNTDNGDPIVLYDHLADRWLISQFFLDGVTPDHEEIAISKTGDPTGAWWLYDFTMPNTLMNDYPKFGVWSDGYYMSDNQFSNGYWTSAGVFVFDRARMLVGDTNASYQFFDLGSVNSDFSSLLPSDLDGTAPPSNTPNYFAMIDNSGINPLDAMYIWEFHVDWSNPSNTTFGNSGHPSYTNAVASFDSPQNIPQPDTAVQLDVLGNRLMHRMQYRYWGSYETLVGCHTVNDYSNYYDHAGVRYYQIRRSLPGGVFSIYDQVTFAPDANHRWMGSAALDGQGNFAIGYSCSSTSLYPSIRYAGRRASAPTGSLAQGETTMYAGSGSQTYSAAPRWGDYTALVVDPSDDLTFWYVNEYYPTTASSAWHTRIGSFRFSTNVGIIGISPSTLSYSATYGGTNPAAQTFVLTNSGGTAFSFTNTITYGAGVSGWLTLSAVAGSVAGRSSLTITASVASASLSVGTYVATNAVTAANAENSPQTLVVTLTVSEAVGTPTGVSASDGTVTGKVQVTWSAVTNATGYSVWRSGANNTNSATLLSGGITATVYDDTAAVAGETYYYWVKATNAAGSSAFSSSDSGWSAAPFGPMIKANGQTNSVTVSASETVTVSVSLEAGAYEGEQVDWWIVANAGAFGWFYLDNAFFWTSFSGDPAQCGAVYQGALVDVPSTTVLPAIILPAGVYDFYFVVDHPMDGILDVNGAIVYDWVRLTVQ